METEAIRERRFSETPSTTEQCSGNFFNHTQHASGIVKSKKDKESVKELSTRMFGIDYENEIELKEGRNLQKSSARQKRMSPGYTNAEKRDLDLISDEKLMRR